MHSTSSYNKQHKESIVYAKQQIICGVTYLYAILPKQWTWSIDARYFILSWGSNRMQIVWQIKISALVNQQVWHAVMRAGVNLARLSFIPCDNYHHHVLFMYPQSINIPYNRRYLEKLDNSFAAFLTPSILSSSGGGGVVCIIAKTCIVLINISRLNMSPAGWYAT